MRYISSDEVQQFILCKNVKVLYFFLFAACGCKGPNDVCDVITGECECPENTVGRTCLPCECNNNTDKCLRTGECLECQFNTTGFYCQHCDNGTFGNALIQQCNGTGDLHAIKQNVL